MAEQQINDVDTIEVTRADGSKGVAKLRTIGIVRQPGTPIVLEPKPEEPSAQSQEG